MDFPLPPLEVESAGRARLLEWADRTADDTVVREQAAKLWAAS